jgi:sterol desaturase/sphingolipid hydroxylase (fatty acid hydroxylase superfamily)
MSDNLLRLGVTLALVLAFLGLERMRPARANVLGPVRFLRHMGLAALGALLARFVLAGGLAGVALWANAHDVGVLNQLNLPPWLDFLVALAVLDFAVWAQHLALHRIPLFWRLHRVHHSDVTMDVSTALRFHPFEILASLGFKALIVMALGAPASAAFVFEVILGATALFSHANIALPDWLEDRLRLVLITPALHLIHHSPHPQETNSNFGFSTCLWDRLFHTYLDRRTSGDDRIGLEAWRSPTEQELPALLTNPLR